METGATIPELGAMIPELGPTGMIREETLMRFRRYYIPNTTIFITQVVEGREPIFRDKTNMALLRQTLRNVKAIHPFNMIAYIFLPDHFHLLFRPTGESSFSQIMHSLKRNYTFAHKKSLGIQGRMKVWQKGFYDHIIRDDGDFQRHLDYIHYNPVKHGLVDKPETWPDSSYLIWKERGAYPNRWGWHLVETIQHMQLE